MWQQVFHAAFASLFNMYGQTVLPRIRGNWWLYIYDLGICMSTDRSFVGACTIVNRSTSGMPWLIVWASILMGCPTTFC